MSIMKVTPAGAYYTSENIIKAKPSLTEKKAAVQANLAHRRWQAEEGGTTLGGMPLATDRVTQAKMSAVYVKADKDPTYTIPAWKSAPGTFSTLDAATIIAAADAIEAHIQACFAREAELSALIDAAENADSLAAIDIDAGWP